MTRFPELRSRSLPELLELERQSPAEAPPDWLAALNSEIEYRVDHPEAFLGSPSTVAGAPCVPDGPLEGRVYASFGRRLYSDLVDRALILLVCLIPSAIDDWVLGIDGFPPFRPSSTGFGLADATLVLLFLYDMTLLVGATGRSWGRRIAGITVLGIDGRPIGFLRSLGRNLCASFVSALFYLGFFWMLWDARRQTWHDKIFGTYVVRVPDTARRAG